MALEHAGQSIIGRLWEQADVQYEKFKGMEPWSATDMETLDEDEIGLVIEYLEQKGKLQGLAYALTIMDKNGMYADVGEGIKATKKEIHARWVANQEDEEEDDGE